MEMKDLFKSLAAAAAVLPMLAGCSQVIGPGAETPELTGLVQKGHVWDGREDGNIVTLRAGALKAGERYSVDSAQTKLVIEGNIPKNVKITVAGELVVNGDVGPGVKLTVRQPYAGHTTSYLSTCASFNGKISTTRPCTQYRYHNDGLSIDDADPAIQISGHFNPTAKAYTYGSVSVNGKIIEGRADLYTNGKATWERLGPY